jgi:signal transduction histidine kinase
MEESRRREISQQLHNTVIQTLSLANLRLGEVADWLKKAGREEEKEVRKVRCYLDEAATQCRGIMSELTPPLLYDFGLVPAIEELAEKLEDRNGTPIRVKADGRVNELDQSLRGTLYQAIRELIVNAVKHAGPCEIRVTLSRRNGSLLAFVRDNGHGFELREAPRPHHNGGDGLEGGFGLVNVRKILQDLGGHTRIRSRRGAGTVAALVVPVKKPPAGGSDSSGEAA